MKHTDAPRNEHRGDKEGLNVILAAHKVLFNRGKDWHSWSVRGLLFATLEGTLRSDDTMVTRTSKKQNKTTTTTTKTMGLESKTATLYVHHRFLYISLPFLPD